jgi:hypothetical protein
MVSATRGIELTLSPLFIFWMPTRVSDETMSSCSCVYKVAKPRSFCTLFS